ncbi:MAG: hypothetical protein ACTHWW_01645 [Arthrobacter sp.]|uniref:hypothetical protein n=1 Tax=unclassified Arthrobacter TaxID=235627 RepID=UPI00264DFEF5|nr:hypothetical protein [Micrococcaceae bacterium]MDN5813360.1 hypothetical protein [Micrococcaceae bacterium]MDN5825411.1 hypothetical protein [Micrococcaceae bacterium]MDN5879391.1 hypothetical protein [Micrococcaceae bacterium]MDN5885564.1 hypothetical protein [Micrococcaceae bacterium]
MRWESLFADLESQLNAVRARERTVEIQEMVRIERSQLRLWDYLAGQTGAEITLDLLSGQRLRGVLVHVGANWLSLLEGHAEYLVLAPGIRSIEVAGERAAVVDQTAVRRRLSQGAALRSLVRNRARVTVWAVDGAALGTGTLDHAGADHLRLARHPADGYRRSAEVRSVALLPFASISVLRHEG